jgi:hypothetical protein
VAKAGALEEEPEAGATGHYALVAKFGVTDCDLDMVRNKHASTGKTPLCLFTA